MTAHDTLLSLLGQWVTVTHPGDDRRTWHGQLAGMMDSPAIVLAMPEGGTEVLPQSFIVEGAAPAADGPYPDPDSGARSLTQLRESGLLWLINRLVFHPRGLALALHLDEHGQAYGWSLTACAEPTEDSPALDDHAYACAEKTITDALAVLPALAPAPTPSLRCARCAGPGQYETQDGTRYCGRCITCTCGQPTCHLNTPPTETPEHACTATCTDPFHGLTRCTKHYPEAGDGFQHEGRSTDGSTLLWNDGEPGTTPHRPDTSGPDVRTVEDDCPDMVGALRTASMPDRNECGATSTDTVRTPYPDTASERPDVSVLQPCGNSLCVHGSCREGATVTENRKRLTISDLAQAFDVSADLLQLPPCSCGQTGALLTVNTDGSHWHIPSDDYEKLQQGRPDVHPAVAAWGQCWDRAENYRTRLELARRVLIEDGYFTADEIGDDIAPRLVEWMSVHRARIGQLTRLLDELLDRMNIPFTINGRAMVRTDYIDTTTVSEWRRVLDRFRDLDAPLRTTGDCPRLDCTLTREDLTHAAGAYNLLHATLKATDTYVQEQQNTGFPFGGGDNRHRILSRIGIWTRDPGPLKLRTRPEPE
ncbi:hypothetical protein ACKI16_29670 [Streptomyces scabiei]|uniref:hypothetical protein n=1 Tax=Streptomyces scabiei TaxID=1930 RepID=UPI0038F6A91E